MLVLFYPQIVPSELNTELSYTTSPNQKFTAHDFINRKDISTNDFVLRAQFVGSSVNKYRGSRSERTFCAGTTGFKLPRLSSRGVL